MTWDHVLALELVGPVLDIGCGEWVATALAARRGSTGIDSSPERLWEAYTEPARSRGSGVLSEWPAMFTSDDVFVGVR